SGSSSTRTGFGASGDSRQRANAGRAHHTLIGTGLGDRPGPGSPAGARGRPALCGGRSQMDRVLDPGGRRGPGGRGAIHPFIGTPSVPNRQSALGTAGPRPADGVLSDGPQPFADRPGQSRVSGSMSTG